MTSSCDIPTNRRMTAATESEGNITIRGEWGTVTYSGQYSDDVYVYRHIIVPRKMWREITRLTAGKTTPLLTHDEVANHLRIPMSTDWLSDKETVTKNKIKMIHGAFATVTETTSCLGERVLVDAEGNRVIAASRRPDGSLRKAIPIRPGYVHKDEQERFITRGTLFRQRVEEAEKSRALFVNPPKDIQAKNKKKKKKKKIDERDKLSDVPTLDLEIFTGVKTDESKALDSKANKKRIDEVQSSSEQEVQEFNPLTENSTTLKKKIQQTKVKLRQIAEIEKKISTAPVKVTAEQYERIGQKEALRNRLREFEELLSKF